MAQKTGMILLAVEAALGTGKTKQLLPAEEDEQVLGLCIGRILAAGICEIVMVVRRDRSAVAPALQARKVKTVINSDPVFRTAESVRAGIAALSSDITGVIIGTADHPYALSPTYALLENVHRYRPDRILIPTYRNHTGHPALFPASLVRAGGNLHPPDMLIAEHRDRVVRLGVEDPGVIMTWDSAVDYSLAAN